MATKQKKTPEPEVEQEEEEVTLESLFEKLLETEQREFAGRAGRRELRRVAEECREWLGVEKDARS